MKPWLILIRHAATSGNGARHVGREDLPLNETGKRQVEQLASALEAVAIGAIFASPLQRAISTAEPLAAPRSLAVQVLQGLVEIDFGLLQGKAKGEQPFNLRRDFADVPMPGGESLENVWSRLEEPCAIMRSAAASGLSIATVCHYWSARLLFGMLQGQTFSQSIGKTDYKPANASAFGLTWNGRQFGAHQWLHHPARNEYPVCSG